MFKLLAVVAVVAAAGWNYMHSENKGYYSDLVLENIEALAEDESNSSDCDTYCSPDSRYNCFIFYGEETEGISCLQQRRA